jgi:hypothetical protein
MTRAFGWRIGFWIGFAWVAGSGSGLAQAPVSGLSGVQGAGQGGVFTIPRVDAHGRGIPGVTRPMLMAGPMGGGGGAGMGNAGGGGGSGMMVNPNWVGAAAMFMPQLLTGNAGNGAGAAGGNAQNPVGNRVVGGFGGVAPRTATPSAAVPGTPVAVEARRTVASAPVAVRPAPAPVDPALAAARLLAHQRDQAKQGSPSAQLALARRYATGNGVEANEAMARVWLEEAARNGSEEAQAELGVGKAQSGS